MLEIEVKVPVKDLKALEQRLKRLGARDFGTSYQRDVYFAHPGRDFAVTDEALRLRVDNDLSLITYKGPKVDADTKTREELEVSVSSVEVMTQVLERLGFRPVLMVSKKRVVLGLRGLSVCLDTVEGLGDFVEFEYDDEDLAEGKRRIEELMGELHLKGNERRSYLELLLERQASKPTS